MESHCTYIPYSDTNAFSELVRDFADGTPSLQPFYPHTPSWSGIDQAIQQREQFKTDRLTLVTVLRSQYKDLPGHDAVNNNIEALLDDHTFTVTTAHQPNLLTGYLYFIYKILHAIKLADELRSRYPGKHFVPVYYMGSEDNDLDELGTFRYEGKRYSWDGNGQKGAVGRMKTASLKPLIDDLMKVLGPPGEHLDELKSILSEAYLGHSTIAEATHSLVHRLFGSYGLVVINPDEPALKKQYIRVMEDDLLHHTPFSIVQRQSERLSQQYKVQAYPRPVNLFYLREGLRERIEHNGDTWQVLHADIRWNKQELLAELEQNPERFSPNVILRGMFQELILPDIAFIGGGAEVAYWGQLSELFDHYHIPFPAVILRQSVLWIDEQAALQQQKLGLETEALFQPEQDIFNRYIAQHSNADWQTAREKEQFSTLLEQLSQKAISLDPTLERAAAAVRAKIGKQLDVLEKKMIRAEKRKMNVELNRISRLKASLFPGGSLQERTDNFTEYYLRHGHDFFDKVYNAIQPLENKFLVIRCSGEIS